MATEPKNSDKNSEPELVPQPNGKGALLTGGVPGNRGGTGRPPNEIRKRYRELNWKVLDELERRDLEGMNDDTLIKLADHSAKIGTGTKQDITSNEESIAPTSGFDPSKLSSEERRTLIELWEKSQS